MKNYITKFQKQTKNRRQDYAKENKNREVKPRPESQFRLESGKYERDRQKYQKASFFDLVIPWLFWLILTDLCISWLILFDMV